MSGELSLTWSQERTKEQFIGSFYEKTLIKCESKTNISKTLRNHSWVVTPFLWKQKNRLFVPRCTEREASVPLVSAHTSWSEVVKSNWQIIHNK